MGTIQIDTIQGPILVDIAGDTPTEEEQKQFLPEKHQFYRQKLIECFKYKQHNYFKGICTGTDPHLGRQNFDWQINFW